MEPRDRESNPVCAFRPHITHHYRGESGGTELGDCHGSGDTTRRGLGDDGGLQGSQLQFEELGNGPLAQFQPLTLC